MSCSEIGSKSTDIGREVKFPMVLNYSPVKDLSQISIIMVLQLTTPNDISCKTESDENALFRR